MPICYQCKKEFTDKGIKIHQGRVLHQGIIHSHGDKAPDGGYYDMSGMPHEISIVEFPPAPLSQTEEEEQPTTISFWVKIKNLVRNTWTKITMVFKRD